MRRIAVALLPALAALVSGCGMMRMNIVVELDKEFTRNPAAVPTIEVNLVGVNQSELPRWKAYSMSAYWSPGDKLRSRADKHEFRFSQTTPSTQTLSRADPVFTVWQRKTASHLFVLADLPGVSDPAPGEVDPRRMILPLSPKSWKLKKKMITVTIRPGQMLCAPAPSKGGN